MKAANFNGIKTERLARQGSRWPQSGQILAIPALVWSNYRYSVYQS